MLSKTRMLSEISEVVWKKAKRVVCERSSHAQDIKFNIKNIKNQKGKNDYSRFDHVKYVKEAMILWWN